MRRVVIVLWLVACTTAGEPGEPVAARWPELVGSWTGTGEHPDHGRVRASLVVGPAGHVSATLFVRGAPISTALQIDAWDGRELTISRKGETATLPAQLAGDVLTVSLPGAGAVTLRRLN